MPGIRHRIEAVIFYIASTILLLGIQTGSAAASGSLKGRVVDKETRDALPGATVMIRGTSIGASTDVNGAFAIHNVPSGEQTVVVTYVGYNSATLTIDIAENGTVDREVELEPTAVQGKAVVVTAQAQGQIQAINQQLSSNTIVNVVSAAKIQELPDFNAAEAIGRLPGVSTLRSSGEANQVVIRGIAPQYNLVSIDQITIGATSKDNRAVDLTMITPYMLQSIDVYKAVTPDMEANAIGGVVNMQLREAPSGLHSDLMWQSGYTDKTSKYDNFKAIAALSDRFLDDKLGAYFLLNAERYDRSADNMNAAYAVINMDATHQYPRVKVNSMGLKRHYETRERYGANLVLDYRLPSGSIHFLNMFSRLNAGYRDYTTQFDYVNKYLNFTYGRADANTDIAINSLQGKYDFGLLAVDLSAANSYSRNFSPNRPDYRFSQGQGIKSVPIPENAPPEALVSLTQPDSTKSYLDQIGINSSDFKENDQVYAANFKIPIVFSSDVSGFLKVGGKYRYNYRTNDESAPYVQMRYLGSHIISSLESQFPYIPFDSSRVGFWAYGFTDRDPKLINNFLDNKFGNIVWGPRTQSLDSMMNYVLNTPDLASNQEWHNGGYENQLNDYKNVERYYAAYGMAVIDIGPQLSIVGGARYEMDAMLFTGYRVKQLQQSMQAVALPATVYPKNHFWLPSVQAKYEVNSWADVRYAFTKTLARPDFTQLSPYINTDLYGNFVNAGNPELKPAESINHDLMVTFHSNELGLISVGGFLKTITNFSYFTQYQLLPDSDNVPPPLATWEQFAFLGVNPYATINTFYNNPYKATVKGIEADLQTRLWYLPAPLNGIVLAINYTHIWSNTRYPWAIDSFKQVSLRPARFKYWIIDSSRAGRLIYQPDDILNASFGYDFKGFSGRISFLYQGPMISGIGDRVENDAYTHDYFRIDASFRQMLPIEGLQVYLDVNNINSRPDISAQQTTGGFTSEQYYGLTADVGIRYTL
jgi:TonB-dependent receptor